MKNRIKELRKKNSYTQEDLSKLLKNEGISANRTTIYRYESGHESLVKKHGKV